MSDLGARLARRRWSIGSVRFVRDVLASVVATGLASVAFSHLSHEPAQPVASPPKWTHRLSSLPGDAPTRSTRGPDSVSMFAMHQPEAVAWSPAAAAAPVKPKADVAGQRVAAAEREGQRRPASVPTLPPTRNLEVAAAVAPAPQAGPAEQAGVRVFGWEIPGSSVLPPLPSGREALRRVAAVGESVAGAGGQLAETIGLKSPR